MGVPGVGGGNRVDLTGRRFGRWLVCGVGRKGTRKRRIEWACVCDCGTRRNIPSNSLSTGASQSCGCLMRETLSSRRSTHSMSGSPTYRTWASMLGRCTNKRNRDYRNYAGRGITVCERWKSFINFLEDMGERPDGMEIDRINNDGNYEPGNCRWATHKENSRNTRKCTYYEIDGRKLSIGALSEHLGITYHRARRMARIANGMPA